MRRAALSLRGLLLCGAAAGVVLGVPHAARAAEPTTLTQALTEAYENNATLQEQRASLRATDETVPTALSGWRPTVIVSETGGHVSGSETEPVTALDPATNLAVPGKSTFSENRTNRSRRSR